MIWTKSPLSRNNKKISSVPPFFLFSFLRQNLARLHIRIDQPRTAKNKVIRRLDGACVRFVRIVISAFVDQFKPLRDPVMVTTEQDGNRGCRGRHEREAVEVRRR